MTKNNNNSNVNKNDISRPQTRGRAGWSRRPPPPAEANVRRPPRGDPTRGFGGRDISCLISDLNYIFG